MEAKGGRPRKRARAGDDSGINMPAQVLAVHPSGPDVEDDIVVAPFLAKLVRILENPDWVSYICWNDRGDAVFVKDVRPRRSWILLV